MVTLAVVAVGAVVVVSVAVVTDGFGLFGPPRAEAELAAAETEASAVEAFAVKVDAAVKNKRDTRRLLPEADRLVEDYPGNADAHRLRGQVLFAAGLFEQALPSLERALALAPKQPEAWHLIGATHEKLGRPEVALQRYDRAIELNNADADYWLSKANVLRGLGRHDAAKEAALVAVQHDSGLYEAHALRAFIQEDQQRHDAALESIGKALALVPGQEEQTRVQYRRAQARMLRALDRPRDANDVLQLLPNEHKYTIPVAEDIVAGFEQLGGDHAFAAAAWYERVAEQQRFRDPAAEAEALVRAAGYYLDADAVAPAAELAATLRRLDGTHPKLRPLEQRIAAVGGG